MFQNMLEQKKNVIKEIVFLKKYCKIFFLSEMPLSANPFPLESSIQKLPGPGGGAPDGGCRGTKHPAKKKIEEKDSDYIFFSSKFIFSQLKKKILKIVWNVPEIFHIEIRQKKKFWILIILKIIN